jgi:phage virion morphogenesis protein
MITIEIDDREISKILKNLQDKIGNLRPIMKDIAGIMHDAVEENFEKQGRPNWKPLSPKTIKRRQEKGYWPGKILQMRGELAVSISKKFDNKSAIVGTNKAYAAIHQFGGKAGRKHKVTIPPRPFLQLDNNDLNTIKDTIKRYLLKP